MLTLSVGITREAIPGTEGITPGPRVDLDNLDLQFADLRNLDLSGASFRGTKLANADLTGSIVQHANLRGADLTGAEITGAVVVGAILPLGLTKEQLYSTESYQTGNLQGINLVFDNDATGWDFSDKNLARSILFGTPKHIDFRGANLSSMILGIDVDLAITDSDHDVQSMDSVSRRI